MARNEYVYALKITWPEGSVDENGWPVKDWVPTHDAWGDPITGDDLLDALKYVGSWGYFRWPANRKYRSAIAADRRAHLFRKYGAQVEIIRSLPIRWTDEPTVVHQETTPLQRDSYIRKAIRSAARIHQETAS